MKTRKFSETLYYELAYANAYIGWYLWRKQSAPIDAGAMTYWKRFCESSCGGVETVNW